MLPWEISSRSTWLSQPTTATQRQVSIITTFSALWISERMDGQLYAFRGRTFPPRNSIWYHLLVIQFDNLVLEQLRTDTGCERWSCLSLPQNYDSNPYWHEAILNCRFWSNCNRLWRNSNKPIYRSAWPCGWLISGPRKFPYILPISETLLHWNFCSMI